MPRQTSKTITNVDRRSAKVAQVQARDNDLVNLGSHPLPPHPFGEAFQAKDGYTENAILHRALSEQDGKREIAVTGMREMLIRHHASPEMLRSTKLRREAIEHLGLGAKLKPFRRFPTNPSTQKGNLAEIVLAEYLVAATGASLPVYRLRYNTNPNQSLKGDDVLAFDLDSDPVRIIIGEAKFREDSSASAVKETIEGLVRSHSGDGPMSLAFVGDRLIESGQTALGERVYNCAVLFALGKLRLDYVGFLMSDTRSATRVHSATAISLRRLAMISLAVEAPNSLVDDCYRNLEDECLSLLN